MGHHLAEAHLALDETVEFSKAIQKAVDLTSEQDTLIVVTADHAHTLSYGGYAKRGNDIFGFGGTGTDKAPYFVLSYGNGPGYSSHIQDESRHDATEDDYGILLNAKKPIMISIMFFSDNKNYLFPGSAPLSSETHGGDDVGLYARGPYSHLFSGVLEENVIPHAMSYASCVGTGLTVCDDNN